MKLRTACRADLPRLTEIYNLYVRTSHATFDIDPFSEADRMTWFDQFDGERYQCGVADASCGGGGGGDGGDGVKGYACSTPFKAKAAYQTSVEVSVYVAADALGTGLGKALYSRLLPALEDQDLHRAYAGIAQPNDSSMKLHEAFGFVEVSRLTEVGRKFDRYWDVIWLERTL